MNEIETEEEGVVSREWEDVVTEGVGQSEKRQDLVVF